MKEENDQFEYCETQHESSSSRSTSTSNNNGSSRTGWEFLALENYENHDNEIGIPSSTDAITDATTKPTSIHTIAKRFHNDGFICLSNVISKTTIDAWLQWSTENVPKLFEAMHMKGHTLFPESHRIVRIVGRTNMKEGPSNATTREGESATENDDNDNTTGERATTVEYAMQCGVKHGFREIVMRSPGRYEISVRDCCRRQRLTLTTTSTTCENHNHQHSPHPPLDDVINNNKLKSLLPVLLTETSFSDLQLCHASLLVASSAICISSSSSPSTSSQHCDSVSNSIHYHCSPDQSWHSDGGHVSLEQHLPCHVLNIFVPLVPFTCENGATELRPQSHFLTRNLSSMMLAAKARKTLQSPVQPLLNGKGDIMIFDYRLLHRGRANQSQRSHHYGHYDDHSTPLSETSCSNVVSVMDTGGAMDRPILVLTYSKPWYHDICNFPKRTLYHGDDDDTHVDTGKNDTKPPMIA